MSWNSVAWSTHVPLGIPVIVRHLNQTQNSCRRSSVLGGQVFLAAIYHFPMPCVSLSSHPPLHPVIVMLKLTHFCVFVITILVPLSLSLYVQMCVHHSQRYKVGWGFDSHISYVVGQMLLFNQEKSFLSPWHCPVVLIWFASCVCVCVCVRTRNTVCADPSHCPMCKV